MKIDSDAATRRRAEARRKIPFLVEFGTEDDIIEFTRHEPSISQEQLSRVVRLFLDAKRARGHFPQPH